MFWKKQHDVTAGRAADEWELQLKPNRIKKYLKIKNEGSN
jgi:hypothetical protein